MTGAGTVTARVVRARMRAVAAVFAMLVISCTASSLIALGLAAAVAATSCDPLEGSRAFARTPAARMLLAEARAAMAAHFAGEPGAMTGATGTAMDSVAWPAAPAAVYVSLADGRNTRACVGRATPGGTLRGTVRELAVQALNADRRWPPVRREDLDGLRVVVSLAGPATPVADPMSVPLAREGLLVRSALGSVAFLPGEARTVAYALREARRIGVLADARDATFERFAVIAISEPLPPLRGATPRAHDEP